MAATGQTTSGPTRWPDIRDATFRTAQHAASSYWRRFTLHCPADIVSDCVNLRPESLPCVALYSRPQGYITACTRNERVAHFPHQPGRSLAFPSLGVRRTDTKEGRMPASTNTARESGKLLPNVINDGYGNPLPACKFPCSTRTHADNDVLTDDAIRNEGRFSFPVHTVFSRAQDNIDIPAFFIADMSSAEQKRGTYRSIISITTSFSRR